MKKLNGVLVSLVCFLLLSFSLKAEPVGNRLQKLQNKVQQERQEIKNIVKPRLPKQIHGKLTLINNKILTVISDKEVVYTINVLSSTQLRRRFGGASIMSEFSVGDELAIVGNTHKLSETEYSATEIDAKFIRNLSIQRRNAVFNGVILLKEPTFFTIETQSKGVQTIYVDSVTVYTQKNLAILYSQLQVRDKVIVKGELWDRALNKIDAKKVIRIEQTLPADTP